MRSPDFHVQTATPVWHQAASSRISKSYETHQLADPVLLLHAPHYGAMQTGGPAPG
jgi:hypothetical protein